MTKHVKAEGTLTTRAGDLYPVRLNLTIAELQGATGIEDEMVSRVELDSSVPDGEYMLDYFHRKEFHGLVRVRFGALMTT
jgi:hypothetical protein